MEKNPLLELPFSFLVEKKKEHNELIDKLELKEAIEFYQSEWTKISEDEKKILLEKERQRKKSNQKVRRKDFRGKRAYSNYIEQTSHLCDDNFSGKEYSEIIKLFWNCYRPSPDDKYKQLHPEEKDIYNYCKNIYIQKQLLQGHIIDECEEKWKNINYEEQYVSPIKQISKQLNTILTFLKQKAPNSYIESKGASYFLLLSDSELSKFDKFIIKEVVSDPSDLFENYPRFQILIRSLQEIFGITAINQYVKETPLAEKIRFLNKAIGFRGQVEDLFFASLHEMGLDSATPLFNKLWDIVNLDRG